VTPSARYGQLGLKRSEAPTASELAPSDPIDIASDAEGLVRSGLSQEAGLPKVAVAGKLPRPGEGLAAVGEESPAAGEGAAADDEEADIEPGDLFPGQSVPSYEEMMAGPDGGGHGEGDGFLDSDEAARISIMSHPVSRVGARRERLRAAALQRTHERHGRSSPSSLYPGSRPPRAPLSSTKTLELYNMTHCGPGQRSHAAAGRRSA
jgi:hypothetical protein